MAVLLFPQQQVNLARWRRISEWQHGGVGRVFLGGVYVVLEEGRHVREPEPAHPLEGALHVAELEQRLEGEQDAVDQQEPRLSAFLVNKGHSGDGGHKAIVEIVQVSELKELTFTFACDQFHFLDALVHEVLDAQDQCLSVVGGVIGQQG